MGLCNFLLLPHSVIGILGVGRGFGSWLSFGTCVGKILGIVHHHYGGGVVKDCCELGRDSQNRRLCDPRPQVQK